MYFYRRIALNDMACIGLEREGPADAVTSRSFYSSRSPELAARQRHRGGDPMNRENTTPDDEEMRDEYGFWPDELSQVSPRNVPSSPCFPTKRKSSMTQKTCLAVARRIRRYLSQTPCDQVKQILFEDVKELDRDGTEGKGLNSTRCESTANRLRTSIRTSALLRVYPTISSFGITEFPSGWSFR